MLLFQKTMSLRRIVGARLVGYIKNNIFLIVAFYKSGKRKQGKLHIMMGPRSEKYSYSCSKDCPIYGSCHKSPEVLCRRIMMNKFVRGVYQEDDFIKRYGGKFFIIKKDLVQDLENDNDRKSRRDIQKWYI